MAHQLADFEELQNMLAVVINTAIEQTPMTEDMTATHWRQHANIEGMIIALGLTLEPPPPEAGMLDLKHYLRRGLEFMLQDAIEGILDDE